MTEKRFEYVRSTYHHYIHDIQKDGEYKKGYRGTYDEFDLDKITDLLNHYEEENKRLKSRINYLEYKLDRERQSHQKQHEKWSDEAEQIINNLKDENEQLKRDCGHCKHFQIDGMFGMWCDINDTDYLLDGQCMNFERYFIDD